VLCLGPDLTLCCKRRLVDACPRWRHRHWHHYMQPRLLWPWRHMRSVRRRLLFKRHGRHLLLAVPRGVLWQRCGASLSSCGLLWVVRGRKLPGDGLHHLHVLPLLGWLLLPHAVNKHVPGTLPAGPLLRCGAGLGHCKPMPFGLLFGWRLNVHGAGQLRRLHCWLLLRHGQHCRNV